MSVAVFVNPHARKNRLIPVEQRVQRLKRLLRGRGRVFTTVDREALGPAVAAALSSGCRWFVADGGDGTFHWLMNTLREALAGTDGELAEVELPPLLPTSSGTMDVIAHKVGIHGGTERLVTRLLRSLNRSTPPPTVALDSLRIQGEQQLADGSKRTFDRVGFALAAGGVGQRFFDKYYEEPASGPAAVVRVALKASAAYLGASLHLPLPAGSRAYAEHVFSATAARVWIDGDELPEHQHDALHAGAFDVSLGGVFKVFPLAREPGKLHFQAGAMTPFEMIASVARLHFGQLMWSRTLVERAGRELVIEPLDGTRLTPVLDGERFNDVTRLHVMPGPRLLVPSGLS